MTSCDPAHNPEPAYINELRTLISDAQHRRNAGLSDPLFPKQALGISCSEARLRELQPGRPSSLPPGVVLRSRTPEAARATPRRSASCGSRGPRTSLHTSERERWICKGAPSTRKFQEVMAVAACEGTFGGIRGGQLLSAIFQETLEKGRICLSARELLDAVLAASAMSQTEAIGIVRTAWENGSIQSYCSMPKALQSEFSTCGLEKPGVWSASLLLQEIYVSPVCKRLTWSLLLTVLRCLNRECIRSSVDVILRVCRGVFGLECGEWDIFAAAALAPRGACRISIAPWPVQHEEGMGDESFMLATTIVSLSDAFQDEANRVLPPYSPKLASAVEAQLLDKGLDTRAINSWLEAHFSALTLPMILVLVSFRRTTSPCMPGGVLVWFWEKMQKMRSQQSETSSDRGEGRDIRTEAWVEEEPTPLEAFISCFYEDLRTNQPLILSQLNNLYRMRSRGHDIKYRSHGYSRLGEFLAEVPGVVLVSSGNQMAVQVSDPTKLAEVAEQVTQGLCKRADDLRARGADTSLLEISYRRPQGVPKKILCRIWELFQHAENKEIPVAHFVSSYKERFPNDRLHLKSLGYQDVRGLMAYVPFVEKIGGRKHSNYALKADAAAPEGYHGRLIRPGPFPSTQSQARRSHCQPPPQPFPQREPSTRRQDAGVPGVKSYPSRQTESQRPVLLNGAPSLAASKPTSGATVCSSVPSSSQLRQTVGANGGLPSGSPREASMTSILVALKEYFERERTPHCTMSMQAYQ